MLSQHKRPSEISEPESNADFGDLILWRVQQLEQGLRDVFRLGLCIGGFIITLLVGVIGYMMTHTLTASDIRTEFVQMEQHHGDK